MARELTLVDQPGVGLRLRQSPIRELALRRGPPFVTLDELTLDGTRDFGVIPADAFEIELELSLAGGARFEIELGHQGDEKTLISYSIPERELALDRRNSGSVSFHSGFPQRFATTISPLGDTLQLRIVVDRSSVELFANGGLDVCSSLIFSTTTRRSLRLRSTQAIVVRRLRLYPF